MDEKFFAGAKANRMNMANRAEMLRTSCGTIATKTRIWPEAEKIRLPANQVF